MRRMRASNLCHCRHDIPRHEEAVTGMVYRNMVDNDTEKRGERTRAATSSGIKKLQDSLGLAA